MRMESAVRFSDLFGFLGLLSESIKILGRNYQFIAIIVPVSLFVNFLMFLTYISRTPTVFSDLLARQILPLLTWRSGVGHDGFRHDYNGGFRYDYYNGGFKYDYNGGFRYDYIKKALGFQLGICFVFFLVSLFFLIATILVSATTHSKITLSFEDLVKSRLAKSFTRPFITTFHITLSFIGYVFFVLAILIAPKVFVDCYLASECISILFGIAALIFLTYLSVDWTLALVISVIEESCYGTEAIGKAGQLLKGKRLHGFALNSVFVLISMILFQCVRLARYEYGFTQLQITVLLVDIYCSVKMFEYIAFTVLYFQCKKMHGEEVELQGSSMELEYTEVPSLPKLVTQDIAKVVSEDTLKVVVTEDGLKA